MAMAILAILAICGGTHPSMVKGEAGKPFTRRKRYNMTTRTAWDELAAALGYSAAYRLHAAFAGQALRIPLTPSKSLTLAVGESCAAKLCAVAGGEVVSVPVLIAYDARAQAMRQARAAGVSANTLAAIAGMSERSIRRMLNTDNPP